MQSTQVSLRHTTVECVNKPAYYFSSHGLARLVLTSDRGDIDPKSRLDPIR